MACDGVERFEPPVVEDEQLDAPERSQQARIAAIAARQGKVGEELGNALVEDGAIVATGLVRQRAGQPGLAHAGQAYDILRTNRRSMLSSGIRIIRSPVERITAIRRVKHAGLVHFVIEGPDGCRALLPAWMTETLAATLPIVDVPRLSLDALRALRGIVEALRISSSPSSGTESDERRRDGTGMRDGGNTISRCSTRGSLQHQRIEPLELARRSSLCSNCFSTSASPARASAKEPTNE